MKTFTLGICLILVSVLSGCDGGPAEENQEYLSSIDESRLISELDFDDNDFEDCVKANAEENGWTNVGEVISLDCSGEVSSSYYNTIEAISVFKNLKTVNLNDNNLDSDDLLIFRKLMNITTLSLANNNIDLIDDISHLDLVELDLSDNIGVEIIDNFASFQNLQKLKMDNNYGVVDFSPIGSIDSLKYLSLKNCAIYDASFLSDIENLDYLYLDKNDIGSAEGVNVRKELSLSSTDLENIDSLIEFDHLDVLNIKDIDNFTCDDYAHIKELLPETFVVISEECSE